MSRFQEGSESRQSQPDNARLGTGAVQWKDVGDVLTVPEAAWIMRIGKSTMYEFVKQGLVPATKLGRKILIAKSDLLRLWATRPTEEGD